MKFQIKFEGVISLDEVKAIVDSLKPFNRAGKITIQSIDAPDDEVEEPTEKEFDYPRTQRRKDPNILNANADAAKCIAIVEYLFTNGLSRRSEIVDILHEKFGSSPSGADNLLAINKQSDRATNVPHPGFWDLTPRYRKVLEERMTTADSNILILKQKG